MKQGFTPMTAVAFEVPQFVFDGIRKGALEHRVTDAQFAEYILWHAVTWKVDPKEDADRDVHVVYVVPTALSDRLRALVEEKHTTFGAFLTEAVCAFRRRK